MHSLCLYCQLKCPNTPLNHLLKNHTLPIPQIPNPHIPQPTLTPRLPQRILKSPHPPLQKPTNKPPALLDLVVGRNPVPRLQHPLRNEAVLSAEIELLRRADADVVQAVQESEDPELRIGCRYGCQGCVGDAVGRVYEGLCCFGGCVREGFSAVAVYGERGALFARGRAEEGVRCEGYEEGGVVVERVFCGG